MPPTRWPALWAIGQSCGSAVSHIDIGSVLRTSGQSPGLVANPLPWTNGDYSENCQFSSNSFLTPAPSGLIALKWLVQWGSQRPITEASRPAPWANRPLPRRSGQSAGPLASNDTKHFGLQMALNKCNLLDFDIMMTGRDQISGS